jgi:hypothetical protein
VKNPEMLPKKQGNVWVCQWNSLSKRLKSSEPFTVEAPAYRETTSTIDPELLDRKKVSQQDRIPLRTN